MYFTSTVHVTCTSTCTLYLYCCTCSTRYTYTYRYTVACTCTYTCMPIFFLSPPCSYLFPNGEDYNPDLQETLSAAPDKHITVSKSC